MTARIKHGQRAGIRGLIGGKTMANREKVIKGLECCLGSNDCDVEPEEDCPYKGICLCAMALRFDVLDLLKEQDAEIRQLRLALDIAKGTCKGIKSGGGQFADMPTMQSAT